MKSKLFSKVNANEKNEKWDKYIKREKPLYPREGDIREEFARDYTRVLHCRAYRRLKNKTQIFFATQNDHICTRIEHVNYVASVSCTISKFLGLNTELTEAIAIGHDLGHPPFGHAGENFLDEISQEELEEKFWHEKNSLRFVDKIETLEDDRRNERNLNLTYAVRDGIICHCGESNIESLKPREKFIKLSKIKSPDQYAPYTWEGCVVKIADKISYLGRDIEDALTLKILTRSQLRKLIRIIGNFGTKIREINNTILIHSFIIDLVKSSDPKKGIRFSEKYLKLIDSVEKFSKDNIYEHERLKNYKEYAKLIINTIYKTLKEYYRGEETLNELEKDEKLYHLMIKYFSEWLLKYSDLCDRSGKNSKYKNDIIYIISNEKQYLRAIIDFISGMTDRFAIKIFNELTRF